MPRPHAPLLLAAILVIARLVSSGAAAAATTPTEASIRAEPAHHRAPTRSLSAPQGIHARVIARSSTLGACLAAVPLVIEPPPRTIVPPSANPSVAPVEALLPPNAGARAPPP